MLEEIYERVIDWVKYAEAKNAALITLNGALIVGISFFESTATFTFFCLTFHVKPLVILVLLLACLPSLVSFIPILSRFKAKKSNMENPNLFFFGDIANISIEKFLVVSKTKYNWELKNEAQSMDLANQIVINSEIARRKLYLFKLAAYFDLLFFAILFFHFVAEVFRG